MCYVSSCQNEWPHLHIIPIEDIMSIRTCEIQPEDWIEGGYLEFKRDYQYERLLVSVQERGFWPDFAPEIIDGMVYDGHHRITMFYDISGHWCPWQDTINYNQWNDDWERYVYPATFEFESSGAR
jgi:hypothetical protein